jgi:hypothetical protein
LKTLGLQWIIRVFPIYLKWKNMKDKDINTNNKIKSELEKAESMASFKRIYQINRKEKKKFYNK